MDYTSKILPPAVALHSADPVLLEWLRSLGLSIPPAETDQSRSLVIYGDDYHQYLSFDLADNSSSNERACLCLGSPVEFSFLEMLRHGVRHIIFRNAPFAEAALRLALLAAENKITRCGGYAEFAPSPVVLDQFECKVLSPQDSDHLWACNDQFLNKHGVPDATKQSVKLALKEALTNAIYHSFRESGSHSRKYIPETFHGLYDTDMVAVNFKLTPDWFSIQVWDNGGSLGPMSVANSMDRHQSNRGIMDTRGRGFYLMRQLSDRMVVCINRRKETSIKMYFLRQPAAHAPQHFELITF